MLHRSIHADTFPRTCPFPVRPSPATTTTGQPGEGHLHEDKRSWILRAGAGIATAGIATTVIGMTVFLSTGAHTAAIALQQGELVRAHARILGGCVYSEYGRCSSIVATKQKMGRKFHVHEHPSWVKGPEKQATWLEAIRDYSLAYYFVQEVCSCDTQV